MNHEQSLGEYVEDVLKHRGVSYNALANHIGVSEGTIRNLIKAGRHPTSSDPNPRILRLVCEYLGLDAVEVFQIAGYLPPPQSPRHRFDRGMSISSRAWIACHSICSKGLGLSLLDELITWTFENRAIPELSCQDSRTYANEWELPIIRA